MWLLGIREVSNAQESLGKNLLMIFPYFSLPCTVTLIKATTSPELYQRFLNWNYNHFFYANIFPNIPVNINSKAPYTSLSLDWLTVLAPVHRGKGVYTLQRWFQHILGIFELNFWNMQNKQEYQSSYMNVKALRATFKIKAKQCRVI